ncbi:PKD-like domain-containing protein, partial [Segetibacter koreensis]|uniref:PKD-like domain-containing protein n=1 Tax=Segetibacter koreensis TaxID=398037 RepID=UPI000476282A
MRQVNYLLLFCILLLAFFTNGSKAQTSVFAVDLSAKPDTNWNITNISRNGAFCNSSNCIKFDVTVNPLSTQLGFDVANPAPTGNSAFYQVNCGPATSLGTKLCVSGVPTFSITFCKTGNDQPIYTLSASRGYSGSADIAIRADGNCAGKMGVQGMQKSSVTWTSIYPGTTGAYNSYLSCTTGCDTVSVTTAPGAPSYIDYKVTGSVNGCSSGSVSDTIRVYSYPSLNLAITPSNPTICSGGPTSVTLTATPTGGNPSYTYSWTGPNGFTSSLQSPTVATAGLYTVSVSDNTNCSPVTKTVTVVASATPTVTSAATNIQCSGVAQNYNITSGVTGTTYTWSRAAVTGVSNAAVTGQTANSITETLINTTTSPVNVTYIITPSANGCTGTAFNYVVTVNPTATVTAVPNQVVCNNALTTAVNFASPTTGGAITYNWMNNAPSIGLAASGSGNIASFTAVNTGTAPVTATITVTPAYANGG